MTQGVKMINTNTVDTVLIETQVIALFNYRDQLGKQYDKLKMSDRKIELRDQIITVNSVLEIMFNEHPELLANWKNLYKTRFEN